MLPKRTKRENNTIIDYCKSIDTFMLNQKLIADLMNDEYDVDNLTKAKIILEIANLYITTLIDLGIVEFKRDGRILYKGVDVSERIQKNRKHN